MPRNRMVKTDYWNDEKLGMETESVQLTFIGTWTFSDDYGVVRANPMWLKNQIFPYKAALRIEVFSKWLESLEGHEMLIPFTLRGEKYYFIRTFRLHQSVEKPSKTRNCTEEELREILTRLGYKENPEGDWGKVAEQSDNSRVVVGEYSGTKRSISISKEKSLRAKALVVSGETTVSRNAEFKKRYKEVLECINGKPVHECWIAIKSFITEIKPDIIEPYADAWNLFADNYKLSKVDVISDSRKKKFNSRLTEVGFDFLKILEQIKTSPRLRGNNDSGWKVTLDWVLENDKNYLKILEGNYN